MIVDLAKMALLAAALPSAFRLVPPCLQVATGPFAGMLVGRRAWGSCFAAKVVGTYEMELRPVLAYIADRPITRFVDVGAAEGYYAIGLCKAMPSLRSVLAFEAEEQGCAMLRRNVKANALVDRVEIGKECGQSELASALGDGCGVFVLCDVEGYESVLLDPDRVPGLARAHLLVEVHEVESPGITHALTGRFRGSHKIDFINSQARVLADFPDGGPLNRLIPKRIKLRMMGEGRPGPMSWLWMRPRALAQ